MDLTTLVITVFCITHDWLNNQRLRQRGPRPILHDSEVLTMEIVGEFLGYDEEEAIYDYFRRHWAHFFPQLPSVHRTTFTRQAANLWRAKEQLWQDLLKRIDFDEHIAIVDSFPQPVCRFARSKWSRLFRGEAAYGYDELAKQTFYGFRFHALVCWPGVIVAAELTPANIHDLQVLDDLVEGATGWVLGDRNYWSPKKRKRWLRKASIWRRRTRTRSARRSAGRCGWYRSGGASKRSLANWSAVTRQRRSGPVICGICVRAGCAKF